jgi:hypothetical protein
MKKVFTYTPQTIADDDGSHYELDSYGDWIGYASDGRRTLMKRTLEAAREDVQAERFVCACWPNCKHKAPK